EVLRLHDSPPETAFPTRPGENGTMKAITQAQVTLGSPVPPQEEEAPSRFRVLAWPIGIICLIACATTATLAVLNRSAIHSLDNADPVEVILPIGFAVIGAMLASRRSRNPIGWIFLGIAFFSSV